MSRRLLVVALLSIIGLKIISAATEVLNSNRVPEQDEHFSQNIFSEKGSHMEMTNIGISEKNRQKVGKILNTLLNNEFVLYVKTLNYHWNIKGIIFHDFHAMFKEQYEKLLDISDEIAERVRTLGLPAHGTMTEFTKGADLKEQPGVVPSATTMVKNLLHDHETIIVMMRDNLDAIATEYGDLGTNNFLTEIMEKHEKIAWMLRATLQK